MILKNKRTKERIQLSYTEFQTRFAKLHLKVLSKQTITNHILNTTKILNQIFISTCNGTLTTLEIQIGILKNYDRIPLRKIYSLVEFVSFILIQEYLSVNKYFFISSKVISS